MTKSEQGVCRPGTQFGVVTVTQSPIGRGITSYLFSSKPRLRANSVAVNSSHSSVISGNTYEYYSFVVVAGSKIAYNISADQTVNVYILDYKNWHTYCYSTKRYTTLNEWLQEEQVRSSYTAAKDDEHFVLVSCPHYYSCKVAWNFSVEYVQYDTSARVDICTASRCVWDIGSEDYVITEVPATFAGEADVTMLAKLRPAIANVVTGVVLGVICGGTALLIVFACRRKRVPSVATPGSGAPPPAATTMTAIVTVANPPLPPPQMTPGMGPPMYDATMAQPPPPPPSYAAMPPYAAGMPPYAAGMPPYAADMPPSAPVEPN
jgi:hypothetical protein